MKFCSKCKRMYRGDKQKCDECHKNLCDISDINEPVRLCITGGTDRALICGALSDADIPYVEQAVDRMGVSNDIVTGYDVKLSNVAVLVPYSAVPKAYDIACDIGVCDDTMSTLVDIVRSDIEQYKSTAQTGTKGEPSVAARTTVKVLTAVLFFILIALAVFGTDYVIELIKNLFGG